MEHGHWANTKSKFLYFISYTNGDFKKSKRIIDLIIKKTYYGFDENP